MPYAQEFLTAAPHDHCLANAVLAFQRVMQEKSEGNLPVLSLPENPEHISAYSDIANYFRSRFKTVIVLGTGGSSLGGQAICALANHAYSFETQEPRLLFLDNIDPDTFYRLMASIDLPSTGFIVISKSGNTAETNCQLLSILEIWDQTLCPPNGNFLLITEEKDSILTRLAEKYQLQTLPHNPHIGGRFAALSLVGLLPAMIAGLDAKQILEGAHEVLKSGSQGASVTGSAWTFEQHTSGKNLSVMMPYCDRLQLFCKWYRQLWAESLGKEGKGITPIAAFGTVDQHSQLQLYLDGPKDKMFTIITTDHKGRGPIITDKDTDLSLSTMGDLMQAEQLATIQTLHNRGCPVRVIHVPDIHEKAIGALMMHFILETMMTADLLKVNAFDQPAVEDGKVLAMKYLKEGLAA
ncbi:MAG: glucose-6-phosphate isomerase [Alphaproteobacteria bacterium]|nr:glucose-6-phosphate isomerase [Alphaproteobacteria bacterium]